MNEEPSVTEAELTPTPRTDAAAFHINADGPAYYHPEGGYVGRDLAETLERELAAARAAIKAFLEKAQVYGRCGETNHPAVKCDVQGLTLGDFYALSAALNTHTHE